MEKLLARSPGACLQRGREAAQMELGEAADALHLSAGVVKALEADDYPALPSATFVKGYIRSYARLLGISGEELVRSYEAITGAGEPEPIQPIDPPRTGPRFGAPLRFGLMLLLALALALVVVGIFYAWLGSGGDPEPVAVERAIESAGAVEASAAETPVEPAPATPEPAPAPALEPVDRDDPWQPPASALEDSAAGGLLDATGDLDAPSTTAALPATVEYAADPLPTTSDTATAASASASGTVTMTFTGDCWVEVTDAAGKRFSDLKRYGETLSFTGEPPFEAKLGNGEVVELSYNGQPVSFTVPPHNVVRVRLGE